MVWRHQGLFDHSSIEGHLGGFQFWSITSCGRPAVPTSLVKKIALYPSDCPVPYQKSIGQTYVRLLLDSLFCYINILKIWLPENLQLRLQFLLHRIAPEHG